MKKVIERIIESPGAPNENDLWLNGTALKKYQNGEWVTISGVDSEAVKYTAQTLTDSQKVQARTNIGAGSDVDLSNALGKLAVLEDFLGITLTPEFDVRRNQPLTFRAGESDVTLRLMKVSAMGARSIEYSLDDGDTWSSMEFSTETTETTNVISIASGKTVLLRGNNESYSSFANNSYVKGCYFSVNNQCFISGNIMSLLDTKLFPRKDRVGDGAFAFLFSECNMIDNDEEPLLLPATTLGSKCYASLFQDCTGLTTAPELPATTLVNGCYQSMFQGCTGLTSAPALPATTLVSSCYYAMFYCCTGLTTAPELPATTLVSNCYKSMFQDCTGLTTAPELPATTLANGCYRSMFQGCTGLTTAPELPATILANNCYYAMFQDCTGLTSAPALPATTLVSSCYYAMFYCCTGLTTAPELPATTLVSNCYKSMFQGCTSLEHIKAMFTTTPESSYTGNWVSGVKATGTFVKNSAATWDVTGKYGVPTGWTVETADE